MKLILILLSLYSCASGKMDYKVPLQGENINNSKDIKGNFKKTWSLLVGKISETAFTINNMDKESGFINIKYTLPTPDKYIDCGTFSGNFKNARMSEVYNFNGASSHNYNMANSSNHVVSMKRTTNLTGTTNLHLTEVGKNKLNLKVNTNYKLAVTTSTTYLNNNYQWVTRPYAYSPYFIEFTTNKRGAAMPRGYSQVECISNGELEKLFLNMIN